MELIVVSLLGGVVVLVAHGLAVVGDRLRKA